ncbi:hypothetical protein FB45DRAFT_1034209 [Roridomyces roridus]|uniref:Cysteine rich secreted protein n=1 Tax=Roridomyces roridus TaxID=1738132 RepID=A0AAD7FFY4_9AGAR|nr:hypothetical protein FB45DRAFT_1034209 [Roridomyces roridus]
MFSKFFSFTLLATVLFTQGALAVQCGPGFPTCASGSVCCLPGETGCCAPPSTSIHIISDLGVCLPPC